MNRAQEDIPEDIWSGIDTRRRKVFDWYIKNNSTVTEKITVLEMEYKRIYRELKTRRNGRDEYNEKITFLLSTRGKRLQEVLKSFILNIFIIWGVK